MKSKTRLLSFAFGLFLLLTLITGVIVYANKNNLRRLIDYGVYSNQFHYLTCEELPDYELSRRIFESQQNKILEFIKKLEHNNGFNLSNNQEVEYFIIDGTISGGYITVRLDKKCQSKAEINATVVSNTYADELSRYFDTNLPSIPYNIINN